ncbi:hypothetical protein [Rhodococcoides trifolii]|nr:hypothetical protein [Rhodococcus trifolii]
MNDNEIQRALGQHKRGRPQIEQLVNQQASYNNEIQHALEQYEKLHPQIEQFVKQYENVLAKQFEHIRESISAVLAPTIPGLTKIAQMASAMVKDARPPNWSDEITIDLLKMKTIAEDEGIPLFYVPRAEIVLSLLEADGEEARLTIIDARYADIGADCHDALTDPMHSTVADRAQLVMRAVEAFEDGHFESAQALAVVVCDSYLKSHVPGRYKQMRESLAIEDSEEAALWPLLRFYMPMAAAVPFLAHWDPSDTGLAPTTLARHVTVHGASTDQLNKVNATIAIMLATSMTRALDAVLQRYGTTAGL